MVAYRETSGATVFEIIASGVSDSLPNTPRAHMHERGPAGRRACLALTLHVPETKIIIHVQQPMHYVHFLFTVSCFQLLVDWVHSNSEFRVSNGVSGVVPTLSLSLV